MTDASIPAENPAPATPEPAPVSAKEEAVDTIRFLGLLAIAVLIFRSFFLSPFNIPSESMQPRLLIGDYLLVNKMAYGYSKYSLPFSVPLIPGRVFARTPGRGDVAVFKAPPTAQNDYIKRVIGLPGDHITFRDGYTYVNGEKLDESYLPTQGITTLPDSMADKTFTVPEGCMFVMGDNRTGSNDSRLLGEPYIPVEAVQARMLVAISVGSDQSWQGVRWIG